MEPENISTHSINMYTWCLKKNETLIYAKLIGISDILDRTPQNRVPARFSE